MKRRHHSVWLQVSAAFMLALVTMSCTFSLLDWGQFTPDDSQPPLTGATATPQPLAEVTFSIDLPAPLGPGEQLKLAVLDEVTGLALNPLPYSPEPVSDVRYLFKLPVPLGSVIKYRYIRVGASTVQEDTSLGQIVRYRMAYAGGPVAVEDRIASWSDQPFNGPTGRINGTVTNTQTGAAIPNALVLAGGVSTLTDSLGQYALEGLPPGTHNLVVYPLDGGFQPFQQGAAVAQDQTTTAPITVNSQPLVQVTFVVNVPQNTVVGAPVRLAGNLLQLGNSYADLSGGLSGVAARMPTLAQTSDGRYSLTLQLPAGADIRYKYTLGDGFWNAEHNNDGGFVVRQLIVPNVDTVINDTVETWQAGPSAPITFEVTVPGNTPANDIVYIQFNPYGWTEPIPMWPVGNNKWVYKLFSPLNMLGSFGYRYCRNGQCGAADDVATAGPTGSGRNVSTSLVSETIIDSVRGWTWWPESEPVTIVAVPVTARQGAFWAGIEFQRAYHPGWQPLYPQAMQNAQALGSNFVVVTPTWTASRATPLVFAPTPGQDPLWADAQQAIQYARALNLNVAVFATPRLQPSQADFWGQATRSAAWWDAWFARYRAFAIYHADLAAQSGAQALILGGAEVLPALPGGTLPDGSSSALPADAEARWRAILADVRARFGGQVLWAVPYDNTLPPAPAFADQVDAIYLLWSPPLAANAAGATVDAMTAEAGRRMDEQLLPFLAAIRKPVVVAINYPSAGNAAAGCVPAPGGGCLDWAALARPYPDVQSATLDLAGQANLYQAVLQAVNQREWISGVVSRGYYPPASLMDKSTSVHGKMTADLLWYWFPRLLGK